ncbi:ketopantoate reductase family protein [Ottowia thiooxydans]|uniref:ketopantoate reductase family protein n=1 Tax=Ottowia thiooxydans TaxID=219182 RepID=UPI00040792BC|nr:2-dehydropantoate 2-reductase [Ottowia thiooxydans]
MNEKKTRVCVIGAGAIGGYLGIPLAKAGAQVSVLARGATLAALRQSGWTLKSGGDTSTVSVNAVDSNALVGLGPQNVVIIAVKAQALADIAHLVPPLIGPETIIVPALNGVPWWFTHGLKEPALAQPLSSLDPQGHISAMIPASQVLGAVIYPACSTPEPGVVRHASGSRLVFGEISGASSTSRLDGLIDLLQQSGLDASASPNIRAEVWTKLLGNACFNPVSVLAGCSTDQLIDDPGIFELFCSLMEETLAVGRALDISLDVTPAARIALTRKLGRVKTSMLQDMEAGKSLEVEALIGAVVEIARRLQLPIPRSESLYALTKMRANVLAQKPH